MLITYWFALANAHLHWNSRGHHRTSCSRSLSAQLVVGAASRFATETGEKVFSLKCRIGSWMLILSSCGGFAQLGSWAPPLHLSHCHSSKERKGGENTIEGAQGLRSGQGRSLNSYWDGQNRLSFCVLPEQWYWDTLTAMDPPPLLYPFNRCFNPSLCIRIGKIPPASCSAGRVVLACSASCMAGPFISSIIRGVAGEGAHRAIGVELLRGSKFVFCQKQEVEHKELKPNHSKFGC